MISYREYCMSRTGNSDDICPPGFWEMGLWSMSLSLFFVSGIFLLVAAFDVHGKRSVNAGMGYLAASLFCFGVAGVLLGNLP